MKYSIYHILKQFQLESAPVVGASRIFEAKKCGVRACVCLVGVGGSKASLDSSRNNTSGRDAGMLGRKRASCA